MFVLGPLLNHNVAAMSGSGGGLGPEIVNDGAFTNTANWTKDAGWTVSGGQGVGVSTNGFLWQTTSGLTAGHTYRVTYTVSGFSAGSIRFYMGSAVQTGTARTADGTYTEDMTVTSGGELGFLGGGTFTGNVSAFSVKEVL